MVGLVQGHVAVLEDKSVLRIHGSCLAGRKSETAIVEELGSMHKGTVAKADNHGVSHALRKGSTQALQAQDVSTPSGWWDLYGCVDARRGSGKQKAH
jgi:hypothetical protein